jgi:hypothetical protein
MLDTKRKGVQVIIPQARVNNAAVTCQVIDCLGFDYLEIWLQVGAIDIALTVLKLTESNVKASATSLTSPSDITGTVFGTDNNDAGSTSVLPTTTDANGVFKFEVDLRPRKRYILLAATVGNGSAGAFLSAIGELGRGQQVPTSAADKNASQLMRP